MNKVRHGLRISQKRNLAVKKNIKGQTQISFGVIFSVFLIIVFVAFAIYGIGKFLEVQRLAQLGVFKSDLQEDIDSKYLSTGGGATSVSYSNIPRKIKQVCFVDDRYENMQFIPSDFQGYLLNNINFVKTLSGSNTHPKSLCIDVINGKVSMILKKDYNEPLVTIAK